MPTATEPTRLTERQREVWEMTNGTGEFDKPMRAKEIAEKLGISANAVYVTRRRVRQILEGSGSIAPKRVIRQKSDLEQAIDNLQAELDGYTSKEVELQNELDNITKRKPEVEKALENLRRVAGIEEVPSDGKELVKAA